MTTEVHTSSLLTSFSLQNYLDSLENKGSPWYCNVKIVHFFLCFMQYLIMSPLIKLKTACLLLPAKNYLSGYCLFRNEGKNFANRTCLLVLPWSVILPFSRIEVWKIILRGHRLSHKHFWTTRYLNFSPQNHIAFTIYQKQSMQLKTTYLKREMVTKVNYSYLYAYTYLKWQKCVLRTLLEIFI